MYVAISCLCSILLHAFNSAFIEGVHGKPSFVNNTLLAFLIYQKVSFVIVYILIGPLIPVRSRVLKGFIYMAFIWGSNYIPQVMGLACADGEIAREAFSVATVICDSLGDLISGIFLGLIVKVSDKRSYKSCSRMSLVKTSIVSMFVYPLTVIVIDSVLRLVNEKFGARAALGVSEEKAISFYLCFYGCFLLTGVLLATFYRLTTYNEEDNNSSLKFGLLYSVGIWTPIVLIMIVFGTAILPTVVYSLSFIGVIMIVTYINGILLKRFNEIGETNARYN